MSTQLPDGLYLHLAEDDYFGQAGALGSTDLVKLYQQGEGWWWSSKLNPERVEPRREALNFGHALHSIVLEGVDAYEARFAVEPDRRDYPDACVTKEDICAALDERGVQYRKAARKDELAEVCRVEAPDVCVWDAVLSAFTDEVGGRETVTRDEDRQLRIMAEAVHSHPDIGPLFASAPGHVPLAEVSVLWTLPDGIRRRARLDTMLPVATGDLKSLGNWSGRPLPLEVGKIIADRGYDLQKADHHGARRVAYDFIRQGRVFGASEAELAWLRRFPAEAPRWGYFWMFYQKPDPVAGRAPILFPVWEDFGSETHRYGHRKAWAALETYRRCMATFGPDKPWTRVERLHEIREGAEDRVFLPHWIENPNPAPDEEEAIA